MARKAEIKGHVQKQVAGAVAVGIIFFAVKLALRKAGYGNLAQDF